MPKRNKTEYERTCEQVCVVGAENMSCQKILETRRYAVSVEEVVGELRIVGL